MRYPAAVLLPDVDPDLHDACVGRSLVVADALDMAVTELALVVLPPAAHGAVVEQRAGVSRSSRAVTTLRTR